MSDSPMGQTERSGYRPLKHDPGKVRRRHGRHTIYVRPEEAQDTYNALAALMHTDEVDGANPNLNRMLDKLYAVEWLADGQPREGQDG